jgi:CHAT domain-containing protein
MHSSFDVFKTERSIVQAFQSVLKLEDNFHKGFYLLSLYQLMRQYCKHYPENSKNFDSPRKTILNQVFTISNHLKHPQLTSYANAFMGAELNCQHEIEQSILFTQKAIFIAQQYHLPELKYRWQWQLAKLLAKNGRIFLAQKSYQHAIETIKPKPFLRQFFHAGRFKSNAFKDSIQPIFMELVHLKLQTGETDNESLTDILELIEQAKIAELQNFFKDECIEDRKAHNKLISYIHPKQAKNQNNEVAVIYPIMSDPPMIIALLNDGPQLFYANTRLKKLKKYATDFHERLKQKHRKKRIEFLGNKLFQSLISPLESCLTNGVKTLIFVPDGELRKIPFSALYDVSNQKYLCQTYAIVTLPALRLTQKQSIKSSPKVLQCGLSLKRHGFSELPHVKVELDKIHRIMGGKVLKDKDFTIDHLKDELNNTPYNTLHFSTHGTFGNTPRDIQLKTYEKPIHLNHLNKLIAICNYRHQPIELLTLSACDTARGDERAALGLGGVAVKTGVATAVASLWKVDDNAAAEIMTSFYQSLKNSRGKKAQSLRLAQISMIESDQFSHPSYWAPFLLMGAWQ